MEIKIKSSSVQCSYNTASPNYFYIWRGSRLMSKNILVLQRDPAGGTSVFLRFGKTYFSKQMSKKISGCCSVPPCGSRGHYQQPLWIPADLAILNPPPSSLHKPRGDFAPSAFQGLTPVVPFKRLLPQLTSLPFLLFFSNEKVWSKLGNILLWSNQRRIPRGEIYPGKNKS